MSAKTLRRSVRTKARRSSRKSSQRLHSLLTSWPIEKTIATVAISVMSVATGFALFPENPVSSAPERQARRGVASDVTLSGSNDAYADDVSSYTPQPTSTQGEVQPVRATISGCLERSDDSFRLKDTSGDAPRSRSWKTAFLRKRPVTIDVVDVANGVDLSSHVGERVSLTGLLADREMEVRSMQRISSSCENLKASL